MPTINLPHEILYGTKKDVEVSVIAKSLIANEQLIREAASILEAIHPGMTIEVKSVGVRLISNGSPLKEILSVAIFMTFQDKLEQEVPKLFTELTGVAVSAEYNTILTVTVMLVAISVIDIAVKRYFPKKDSKELEREYKAKLERLASLSGKSVEEIDTLVKDSIGNKLRERLISMALNFFSPSKMEGATKISAPNGLEISEEAVAEIPSDLEYLIEENQIVDELKNVKVEIHRADIDSRTAGWRAVIPELSSEKIRMELSPEIKPKSIYGETTIQADVLVVYEKQTTGEYVAKMYHLMQVYN